MNHPTYDRILEYYKNIQKKNDALVIVDAGCGNGLFLTMIEKLKFKKYRGYDISRAAITEAKRKWKKNKNIEFKVSSCTKIPVVSGSADLVVSIGVLQYLTEEEREKFFLEAKRILRPGGQILISCLSDHLIYRVFDLYGLFSKHGVVNKSGLISLITSLGFKVKNEREYGLIVAPLASQVFCFFADSFDHFVLGTRGKIGGLGRLVRDCFYPLERIEYEQGPNYGYTLILNASSSGNRSRVSRGKT